MLRESRATAARVSADFTSGPTPAGTRLMSYATPLWAYCSDSMTSNDVLSAVRNLSIVSSSECPGR